MCFLQLLCPLSCWSVSVCPRERWGCPAPLREGTVLSTAGLWMETHWQMLSSSLEIMRLTTSLWSNTSQENWSVQSGITSVVSRKKRRYLPVVSENMSGKRLDDYGTDDLLHQLLVCFFPVGFIFIDCTSNGTHISQWVLEANNTLCHESTTTTTTASTTITEGKTTGITVSNKPSTHITTSNQTSPSRDDPWYIRKWKVTAVD